MKTKNFKVHITSEIFFYSINIDRCKESFVRKHTRTHNFSSCTGECFPFVVTSKINLGRKKKPFNYSSSGCDKKQAENNVLSGERTAIFSLHPRASDEILKNFFLFSSHVTLDNLCFSPKHCSFLFDCCNVIFLPSFSSIT